MAIIREIRPEAPIYSTAKRMSLRLPRLTASLKRPRRPARDKDAGTFVRRAHTPGTFFSDMNFIGAGVVQITILHRCFRNRAQIEDAYERGTRLT
jgi:hypothetical protein